jgi:hypothetical protein
MHRKPIFVLAGIFLAVALIVPPVVLVLQANSAIDNYSIAQNPDSHSTGGVIALSPEQLQQNRTTTLIIVAVIEVVFALLFAVTLWFGINHPHPEH